MKKQISVFATAILASLLLIGLPLGASTVTTTGAGVVGGGGGGGYTGPGDVQAFTMWFGLRCYNTAYAGNVADVWDAATGNTTNTLITCSSGGTLNTSSPTALATTCAVSCNVKTLYDQVSATGCGSAPCDLTVATNANRPLLTLNCLGTLPCMTANASAMNLTSANSFTPATGVGTISVVGKRTVANTPSYVTFLAPMFTGTAFDSSASADNWENSGAGGGGFLAPAVDGTWNAGNLTINGASSVWNIGGTETTGTVTGNTSGGSPQGWSPGGSDDTLQEVEAGYLDNVAINNTVRNNLCSNQRAYWASGGGTIAGSC